MARGEGDGSRRLSRSLTAVRSGRLVAAAPPAALFAALAGAVAAAPRDRPDRTVEDAVHRFVLRHPVVADAARVLTYLGNTAVLAMVLAAGSAARRLVHAGAAVLVLVVCATRVVLGVHWASDVLGGMLLSATLLTVASALGPRGPTPSS